jgi:hypothetical protein
MRIFGSLPSLLSSFIGRDACVPNSEVQRLTGVFCRLSAGNHPLGVAPTRRFNDEEISMLVQNP